MGKILHWLQERIKHCIKPRTVQNLIPSNLL
jgi:hypothetical protein